MHLFCLHQILSFSLRGRGLLLRVASDVFDGKFLAFKGATAIDQFIRDMPRFPVDLDLVHVKHMTPRKVAAAKTVEF